MITALDFEYAGQASASYGLRIANFDSSIKNSNTIGPSIRINEAKVKHRPSPYFLNTEVNSTLSFPLTLVYVDENSGDSMHKQEISRIARWLLRQEYYPLKVIDEEYGGVIYDCILTDLKRVDVGNYPFALELTAKCADPWGRIVKKITKNITGSETIEVRNISSLDYPIFPKLKVIMNESGDFFIANVNTDVTTIFTGLSANESFIVDFDTRVVLGDRNLYENCNFKWVYLNSENSNTFAITANATIELIFEFPFIA
jgi:phage-related protein